MERNYRLSIFNGSEMQEEREVSATDFLDVNSTGAIQTLGVTAE